MLLFIALVVAAAYLLVLVAVVFVLVRRRARLPEDARPPAGPVWWLTIGGVLFSPVIWVMATVAVGLIADVVAGDLS